MLQICSSSGGARFTALRTSYVAYGTNTGTWYHIIKNDSFVFLSDVALQKRDVL